MKAIDLQRGRPALILMAAVVTVAALRIPCTPAQGELGQEQREQLRRQAADLSVQSVGLYRAGQYPRAIQLQEQALAIRRSLYPAKDFPDGHPELAVSLNNLGAFFRAAGDYEKALGFYQEALKMNRKLYPANKYRDGHPDLASSLNNLGVLLRLTGEYAAARKHLQEALEMNEKLHPADKNPDLATTLNNLGDLLQEQGNYLAAKGYYLRALELRRKLYPKGHPELAASLNNLGTLLKDQADYPGAKGYYLEALELNKKLYSGPGFPNGHPDLVATTINLAGLYRAMADYPAAKAEYQQALAMSRKLYPAVEYPRGHPALASNLNNIGTLLQDMGESEAARDYYEQALAMRRRLYPAERYPHGHPALAVSLNNLGSLHRATGDYVGARVYYERALAMNRTLYPAEEYPQGHPALATSLNNLADLLHERGEYAAAQDYYEQALALNRELYELYPQGHPDLATSLHNLGELYHDRGNFKAAAKYYLEALAMRQGLYPAERYPRGHPALAASLNNLGTLHRTLRRYDDALLYYERARAMNRTLYPAEEYPQGHPALATSLNNLADVLQTAGKYEDAKRYSEDALELRKKLYPAKQFPKGHPDLAASLNNLGDLLLAMGKRQEAQTQDEQALAMYQNLADTFTASASEAEALNFAARLPVSRDALLSATRNVPGTEDAAYAALWHTKAAISYALERRQAALRAVGNEREIEDLVRRWNDTRLILSRLLLSPAVGKTRANYEERIQQATRDKETLEQQLAERVPQFKRQQELQNLKHADLVKALKPGVVFIDFVQYVRSEQDPRVPGREGERRELAYAAFVLCKGRPVVRVELGEAAREAKTEPGVGIALALTAWRVAIGEAMDRGPGGAEAEALRRLVWAPLAPHVPEGTRVLYLAPDGALARLPWAALPTAAGGPTLLERFALAVVPHGPFLLERLAAPPRSRRGGTLLAVGGVDYNNAPDPLPAECGAGPPEARRPTEPGRRVWDWPTLPQSGPDLKKLVALAAPRMAVPLEGKGAGAQRLLCELPRARWAVLATHAFYADNELRRSLQEQGRVFLREPGGERAAPGARNPQALCGLALAGANLPPARNADGVPVDDGLLSAEAVAGLPLGGLDLAVLAACHTALGEVAAGEGVFGLQRAFHLAGARDVVAALWQVEDTATAALMSLFHQLLWRERRPPLEALRLAQLYLYRHPDQLSRLARSWEAPGQAEVLAKVARQAAAEADNPGDDGERSPTWHWAGFTLSGLGDQPLD